MAQLLTSCTSVTRGYELSINPDGGWAWGGMLVFVSRGKYCFCQEAPVSKLTPNMFSCSFQAVKRDTWDILDHLMIKPVCGELKINSFSVSSQLSGLGQVTLPWVLASSSGNNNTGIFHRITVWFIKKYEKSIGHWMMSAMVPVEYVSRGLLCHPGDEGQTLQLDHGWVSKKLWLPFTLSWPQFPYL